MKSSIYGAVLGAAMAISGISFTQWQFWVILIPIVITVFLTHKPNE